jgi:coenzyme PQQ precursor peptide PqqA
VPWRGLMPATPYVLTEDRAMWIKPAYTDLRIGFEVTMYFANR